MFLHSLWRGGSTYIWSRFRALPQTRAFYDPLNIDLAKLTQAKLDQATPGASPHLRHPELTDPYFAEYAPLLRSWGRRGVGGYRRTLGVDRLFLASGDDHPALEAYLDRLVSAAQAERRSPVLGLTMSFGRIGWLASRFGGRHIHVDRAPEALWGSYMDQMAAGNPWFVARWLAMIEANCHHPMLRPLAEALPLRAPLQRLTPNRKQHYRKLAGRLSAADVYRLTFYAWVLAALEGLAHAHVMLDMNRIVERRYRADMAATLYALTGLPVDFDGARIPEPCGPELDPLTKRRMEAEVLRSLPLAARKMAAEARATGRLSALAPRKAELLASLA